MKSPEKRHKTTAASAKRVSVTRLSCNRSGKSPNRASKQRQKSTGNSGNALVSPQPDQYGQIETNTGNRRTLFDSRNEKFLYTECGGLPLPFTVPPLPSVVPLIPGQSSQCFQKFKLQLFPIDELTRKGLEKEKHNPYLELTLGFRKKISSVVKHLNVKWGKSEMATGELMLLPYYAQLENLANYIRWTSKDCDTCVADVHTAIGKPALFRLRYGWFSDLGPKVCGIDHRSKDKIVDEKQNSCAVVRCGPAPTVPSHNQDGGKPSLMEKAVQALDNPSGNSAINLWDLSNISFGALLSEDSAKLNINANANPVTCDTFDAAIARLKDTNQSTSAPQSSIFDAEEACNAFSFRKITSSRTIPAQSKDTNISSSIQKVSSSPLKLRDLVVHREDDACQKPMLSLETHSNGIACSQPLVDSQPHPTNDVSEVSKLQLTTEASQSDNSLFRKLGMNWPESLGPLDYATMSFKDIGGNDSIGLGLLIANSRDAFQNVSIF